MKILHVSGPSSGGIGRHIQQLQKGLAAWGVDSTLAPPVKVRPGSVAAIALELRRGQYDLVHCHGFQGSAVGRAAAVVTGVPAIVTLHNTLQVGGLACQGAKLVETLFRRRTTCWVAVSSYLRNYAWQTLKVPGDKTEVISNGVDIPGEIPPMCLRPVVGIVARLIPAKGVDMFLRAIQVLRPELPELRAVVIGDGPAKYALKGLASNLGLDGTVEFLGHREDVPDLLKSMAVFVLPTRSEGLGISILEAMAMGVPVVATAVGGVPELVQHQRTGLLAPVDEFRAIARSVRDILDSRERAERLRQSAFSRVAKQYNSQLMLERTLAVYRRAAHV